HPPPADPYTPSLHDALPILAPAPTATPAPTPTLAPTPTPVTGRTYTVRPGDELKHIAADYGVSIWKIIDTNTIADPDSLRVGQVDRKSTRLNSSHQIITYAV